MRKWISFFLFLLWTSSVSAANLVVIQANDSPFGRRYFSGFSSLATERVSAFTYNGTKTKSLVSRVRKLAPDLVFTVGEVPLKHLTDALPSTPFLVGDYYVTSLARRANVVMMESKLPIDAGLTLTHALLPKRGTVGTIFNPKFSQAAFDVFVEKCGQLGLRVASLKVASPQDIRAFLSALQGKADVIYWIRDSTTSHPSSVKEIFAFAQKNSVPVVSLDPSHIYKGALLAVAVDPFRLGEQAWKTANIILKEGKIPQMPVSVGPAELTTAISLKECRRFGITPEALVSFLQKGLGLGYHIEVAP